MYTRRLYLALILSCGWLAAQDASATVEVTGVVKQTLKLTADDLAKMPRASVKSVVTS